MVREREVRRRLVDCDGGRQRGVCGRERESERDRERERAYRQMDLNTRLAASFHTATASDIAEARGAECIQ